MKLKINQKLKRGRKPKPVNENAIAIPKKGRGRPPRKPNIL